MIYYIPKNLYLGLMQKALNSPIYQKFFVYFFVFFVYFNVNVSGAYN